MGEGLLFPGEPYQYWFEDGIDQELVDRMVTLWCHAWTSVPENALGACVGYLEGKGYMARPLVSFLFRQNRALRSFAWTLTPLGAFLFKPEVLQLFSDDSIKAMYGHEIAHVFLTWARDPDHIYPCIGDQALERERKADARAKEWGFSIDEGRSEEKRLRSDHPYMFL